MASCSWIALGLSVFSLAGCTAKANRQFYGTVPDFELTDQSNQLFLSAKALLGKIWIADFIFTNCPGPCPRMSSQMREVATALHDVKDLRMVSFTVDPARDTPEALGKYAAHYDAQPGVWFFLTGPQPDLHYLAKSVFKLGDVNGDLEHSTRFVLIDQKSRIRGYYLTSDADAIQFLIADAKQVSKEQF
jgi:protein SCO1